MNENKSSHLKCGSEWIDHEDCLVGDETGLRNLIKACEVALEKNEYYGSDLGDYVGVKKLESNWFKEPSDSHQTKFQSLILAVVLGAVGLLIIVGLITVIKWLF